MQKVLTVTVELGKESEWTPEERARELRELAYSLGAETVSEFIVRREKADPALYIGKGKLEEIAAAAAQIGASSVIFNNDLSGTQQRNLERSIGKKVIDRTQLILGIFARRARSNEGKTQVELAQLLYMLPRLTGKGVELSRLGGGIGTVGPGEQKLEIDRRRIRERISRLKAELEKLRSRRGMMRKKRRRFSLPTIAIIGYTNAGKSTLLNALTSSDVTVEDKLFSTLDPTVRKCALPDGREALFVDTVGFIDALPHNLVEAFKATLEEVAESDMLLHVVDISHPKAKQQAGAVYKVLEEIGARCKRVVTALNKADKMTDAATLKSAAAAFPDAVPISALKREGLDRLMHKVGHP
jgi:GTP-binding protein HflX